MLALKTRRIELRAPLYQDDQAYAPDGWSHGDDKHGLSFVRLRTVAGRHTFTLKRPAENALSCAEYETVIGDRHEMHAAVVAMGFRPTGALRMSGENHGQVRPVGELVELGQER